MVRPKSRRGSGFSHRKRGRGKDGGSLSGRGTRGRQPSRLIVPTGELEDYSDHSDDCSLSSDNLEVVDVPNPNPETPPSTSSVADHDYSRRFESPSPEILDDDEIEKEAKAEKERQSSIYEVISLLRVLLPNHWIPIADQNGFHILKLSLGDDKMVQRDVFIDFNGQIRVSVHRRKLSDSFHQEMLSSISESVCLTKQRVKEYVDRIQSVALYVRAFEICAGQDSEQYEQFWKLDDSGSCDLNLFDESRFKRTFRTLGCQMLVPINKWVCEECRKAGNRFRHRTALESSEFNPNTRNDLLTEEQKLQKLGDQRKKIKNLKKRISVLENRITEALQSQGVELSASLSEGFRDVLKDTNLTPLQELFLHQQFKSASLKNTKSMRWHPTMIRFALLIKSTSSAAYRALKQSGLISLPGERTLFDYSHAIPKKHGINNERINVLGDKVRQFIGEHQKYHNLLMDEIHISQKLVYSKATGELIGYISLDEVSEEMRFLVEKIKSNTSVDEPPIASTILTYMVKGVANNVKEVVAAFPTSCLTYEAIFEHSWNVIENCEVAGVKVLAIVCDGNAVNRSFFQMHKPVTVLPSGLVFDTINLCAPDRILYFISDVPHLLKTIRNCFAKSGVHSKCKKKLTKGGQVIVWKTIEKLFMIDHSNTWRRNCKLNSMNVYLNSYSCMKVLYAAQVLSKTTSLDLKERNWPGTSETVDFIQRVNDFFDCLNGAHTEHGHRKANDRLNPYTDTNDKRFVELEEFLQYLKSWEAEVQNLPGLSRKEKEKLFLPKQTLDGIEITIRAFTGAVKFMLSIPSDKKTFVNARVFCQDPLEQYFGKQRSRLGGSNSGNVDQFFDTDNMISLHRDLNVRRRSGNTEAISQCMEITEETLPKRRRTK